MSHLPHIIDSSFSTGDRIILLLNQGLGYEIIKTILRGELGMLLFVCDSNEHIHALYLQPFDAEYFYNGVNCEFCIVY